MLGVRLGMKITAVAADIDKTQTEEGGIGGKQIQKGSGRNMNVACCSKHYVKHD